MSKYDSKVNAHPVKGFFVSMLTRDITLGDAILDLLDNCIDGVLRNKAMGTGSEPYSGFYANITFSKNEFSIVDNCGGIPWSLHNFAFKMGKPPKDKSGVGTVGVYGIGMKRAIFKIGMDAKIKTKTTDDQYEVHISPEWMRDEEAWDLPVKEWKGKADPGTEIVVTEINSGVSEFFGADRATFENELIGKIASQYCFIINKGFKVRVNGKPVPAKAVKLAFDSDKRGIRPYIYRGKIDGVNVFIAVGFTRPIPSDADLSDIDGDKYSSIDSGWTIVCNDRAVVYCDRTELTGWGDGNVPSFHNQFIAISGIVEFQADDPALLPTTTTKRGIDASSRLYMKAKNKMREGMKIYTNYTYKWKGRNDESKKQIAKAKPMAMNEIKALKKVAYTTESKYGGRQYKPSLPSPSSSPEEQNVAILYYRKKAEVSILGRYLFEDEEAPARRVGEKCFEETLAKARK